MSEILNKKPFEDLLSTIRESDYDTGTLGIEDSSDSAEALHLLMHLTGHYMPDNAANHYTTFPRFLSVAKRIAEITLVDVPVSSNSLVTHPGITITAESDLKTIWQDALQDDQTTYYWALKQYEGHEGEEGWEWAKEYADSVLNALDRNYDLSNNREACLLNTPTKTT